MRKSAFRILGFVAAFVLAAATAPAGLAAPLDPVLNLTVDERFPVLGGAITFSITGPPDATFDLKASTTATERFLPAWGRVFIDIDGIRHMGDGALDSNGEATVLVNVPNNSNLLDRIFHFQARAEDGADKGVSNSISVRIQTAPPAGPRQPAAIAVTPDGTKAYVAHERDATISVIDAVNDVVLDEIPIGPIPTTIGKPITMGIDPEGRHLYIADPRRREIVILHVKTDSIAGMLDHAASTNGIAFDFSGPKKMIYFTNTKAQAVLPYEETPNGTYVRTGKIAVEGRGPGPIVVLPDRTIVVGNRHTLDVEFVEPISQTTLGRTPIGSLPLDLLVRDDDILVSTFTPEPVSEDSDGRNEVLVIDSTTFLIDPMPLWPDIGTDYLDLDGSSDLIAMATSGSGSVLFADRASLAVSDVVEVAPGEPTAHNVRVAFVPDTGSGERAYTLNHFRETIRPIDVSSGPPFVLGAEIALAHAGQPQVPLSDLSDIDNGDWLFSTVEFFNGTATNPNPVTCNTCHTWFFSAGFINVAGLQAQPLFDLGNTGPWLYAGTFNDLNQKTNALFNSHGKVGGMLNPMAAILMTDFQDHGVGVPSSPFLEPDGSLSDDAIVGKALFEGVAGCTGCHVEPWFIPVDMADRTIDEGVGTGMAPINVTTLLGLWSTATYLHDGSAESLLDVLLQNTNDEHGTTSTLNANELDQIVAYLQSL